MVRLAIIQDTRREKKGQKYPLKLRVTYNRTVKYYPANIDLTKDEFACLNSKRTLNSLVHVKADMLEMEANALAVVRSLRPFSFPGFEKKFVERPISKDLLGSLFNNQISKLIQQGRIGTASCYQTCFNSIMEFDKRLSMEKITGDLLYQYENWMLGKGKSITTVGIYLRSLRAIFNEAIDEGLFPREFYPFGKKKYQIPTGRNVKKALSLSDIEKFYNFSISETDENYDAIIKAKDFWLFSYFGNGINMKDVSLLKYKNIHGEYIVIERAKTLRTTRSNPQPITIYINEDIQRVLDRWGNKDTKPDNLVFSIIDPTTDLIKQRDDLQQFIQNTNRWTKRIAEILKIPAKVTTYTARHSFSTVMKRAGASVEFISEALGHKDVKTTESYLDSFENEMKKEFASALSAFKMKDNSNRGKVIKMKDVAHEPDCLTRLP